MFRAVFVDNSMGFEDVDLLMRKQTLVVDNQSRMVVRSTLHQSQ